MVVKDEQGWQSEGRSRSLYQDEFEMKLVHSGAVDQREATSHVSQVYICMDCRLFLRFGSVANVLVTLLEGGLGVMSVETAPLRTLDAFCRRAASLSWA